MTTLNEFLNDMIAKSNEVDDDEPSYDYESMAFEAGIEFAAKKIKEFLAQNKEEEPKQDVTLVEYIGILHTLSENREEEDFNDRDVGWEESGYQSALQDVRNFLCGNKTAVEMNLQEYRELD